MVIHEKIKLGAIAPRLIFSWITISSCGYQVMIMTKMPIMTNIIIRKRMIERICHILMDIESKV